MILVAVALACVGGLVLARHYISQPQVPWNQFIKNIDDGQVSKVQIGFDDLVIGAKSTGRPTFYRVKIPGGKLTEELYGEMDRHITARNQKDEASNPEAGIQVMGTTRPR